MKIIEKRESEKMGWVRVKLWKVHHLFPSTLALFLIFRSCICQILVFAWFWMQKAKWSLNLTATSSFPKSVWSRPPSASSSRTASSWITSTALLSIVLVAEIPENKFVSSFFLLKINKFQPVLILLISIENLGHPASLLLLLLLLLLGNVFLEIDSFLSFPIFEITLLDFSLVFLKN